MWGFHFTGLNALSENTVGLFKPASVPNLGYFKSAFENLNAGDFSNKNPSSFLSNDLKKLSKKGHLFFNYDYQFSLSRNCDQNWSKVIAPFSLRYILNYQSELESHWDLILIAGIRNTYIYIYQNRFSQDQALNTPLSSCICSFEVSNLFALDAPA